MAAAVGGPRSLAPLFLLGSCSEEFDTRPGRYTLMSNQQLIPIRLSTLEVKVRSHVLFKFRTFARHTSHVTRHTSHVTHHTSHITHHTQPVPRPPQAKIDKMNAQALESVMVGSVSSLSSAKAASKILAAKARAPAKL